MTARRARWLGVLCALSWSCSPAPEPAPQPSTSATPAVVSEAAATATTPRLARSCAEPSSPGRLAGPAAGDAPDLDLQFHWRAATVCQELHALEHDGGFRPFEKIVVGDGEGHRVLLLLPSLSGAISVARYRVDLAAAPSVELIAWLTLEASAASHSDGVEFGVGVHEEGAADDAGIAFERLTRAQAAVGWRELRVDLSAYRGKTVWISLASREAGDRSGDWLLWGDPRVVVKQAAPAHVDLGAGDPAQRRELRGTPWSEANVFKAYSGFNEDRIESANPRWVARMFPWLTALRLFSSLGANWGPTLDRDHAAQMGHNPTRDSSEEQRWAAYYEFFRDGPGFAEVPLRERFSWTHFDQLMARVAATGVRMHVNLAGAPELFTGGQGHYHTYHYNEMPVVDEAGWKAYVAEVFRHLSRQPWFARARFSFFSEPNCRWVTNDGSVKHFGYQGDAAQYARQYLWTWQAMKPYVAPGQIHLGPFVVEPDPAVPAVDNLPEHLRLLREEFARAGEPLPPWSGFAFNIYETPQLAIDHFASYKIDYVRRLLATELPGVDLPLRFDEVGIHPLIAEAFAASGVPAFEGSRWAAAWHAEMLALLVEQRIAVGSPWLFNEMLRPYASYAMLSLATGALASERAADGSLAIVRGAAESPSIAHVKLGSRSADRVGHLWSGGAGRATYLAVWQLPRFPASDARLAQDATTTAVGIRVPQCDDGRCTVSVLGYDDQSFAGAGATTAVTAERMALAAIPQLPSLRRVAITTMGDVALGVRPGEVYLVEVTSGVTP